MTSIFRLSVLILLSLISVESRPQERDWGLKRGWSWQSFSYFWYWRHGLNPGYSDRDTICQQLWNVNVNRLQQGINYNFLLQRKVPENSLRDRSYYSLFRSVKLDRITTIPTFRAFIDLLSNFQPSPEGSNGLVADAEVVKNNIDKFFAEVFKTRVFDQLFWFLVRQDLIPPNKAKFKDDLPRIWFNNRNITSKTLTGFQKIFVGETVFNPAKISLRNWIQFYNLEKKGDVNYFGYSRAVAVYDPKIISAMFSWREGTAVSDNIFVGTSPEFELALYTLCFYVNPGKDCECKVNTRRIMIKTVSSTDGSTIRNADFDVKI